MSGEIFPSLDICINPKMRKWEHDNVFI
jgi:hypothetical protein